MCVWGREREKQTASEKGMDTKGGVGKKHE